MSPIHEVVKVDFFLPGCPPPADAFWQILALSVVTPEEPHGGHSGRGARRARRQKQRVILAAEIIAAVIAAVILLWFARSVCRYTRKKRQLEDDRALLVTEQVKSAIERVGSLAARSSIAGSRY